MSAESLRQHTGSSEPSNKVLSGAEEQVHTVVGLGTQFRGYVYSPEDQNVHRSRLIALVFLTLHPSSRKTRRQSFPNTRCPTGGHRAPAANFRSPWHTEQAGDLGSQGFTD